MVSKMIFIVYKIYYFYAKVGIKGLFYSGK